MTQRFNTEAMLKTRQFIELDHINAQEKMKSLKEKPKKQLWRQTLILLRQRFQLNKEP